MKGRSDVSEFARSSEISHIEARRSCQENSCYRAHTHDTFSIGLIDSGTSSFAGMLAGRVRLEPGDVIVIPAHQVHACNPLEGVWEYQMIHADQDWLATLPPPEASELFASISVLRDPALRESISATMSVIFADESSSALERTLGTLLGALSAVVPAHRVPGDGDAKMLATLAPAIERLRSDETNPRISDLATLVGMDRYQFIREMKRATGLSPVAWRQNARVLRARHMLRTDQSIADIAHTLGFADQSHFHRIFRAHVAASPGAYRR